MHIICGKSRILPTGGLTRTGLKRKYPGQSLAPRTASIVIVIGHLWYYSYMVRKSVLLEEMCKEYVLLLKAEGNASH